MFESLSQAELHHRIAEDPSPTLVFFTAEGCGACRHLKQVLLRLRQRRPEWLFYEINAQQEMGLTREFEVFHLPALFLFHNGDFHAGISAEARPEAIERAVIEALRQAPKEAP